MSPTKNEQQGKDIPFEDIAKARNLLHEDEMTFFAPRAIPATHKPGEHAAHLLHTSVAGSQAGQGSRSHDATPQESPSGTPSKQGGNMFGRLFAPFIAHAGGTGGVNVPNSEVNAPTSGPPPNSIEKPGLPKPVAKYGNSPGHEESEAVMAKHAAESMLNNLPDAFARFGEAVGGGVQYMVNKTVEVAHNVVAPLDEGLEHRRPASPNLADQGIPGAGGIDAGSIDSPGAADSSLRMEELRGMMEHDVSPARKRETLVDHLTYPFTKDADDPSRAIDKARSYYEYLEEKKEDARHKFTDADPADIDKIAPGSMPNAPTSIVNRSTHTQLESHPAHAGAKAHLDDPRVAANMEGGLPNKGLNDNANVSAMGFHPKAGGGAGAFAAAGTGGAANANGIVGFAHTANLERTREAATDVDQGTDISPVGRPRDTTPTTLKETSFLSGLVSKFEGLLSGSDGRSTAERTDATHPLTAAEPAGPAEESTRCADVTGPGDLPDDNTTKSTTGGDQVDQGSARAPGDILTEPPTTTIGERMWARDVGGYGRGASDIGAPFAHSPRDEHATVIPVVPFTSTEELLANRSA